jgi:DNA-directed RNA polymerase specialized sigma subunit
LNNLKLNNAVLEFQRSHSDESYAIIHEATIEKVNRKLEKIASSVRSNYPDTRALYEDVLLRCIERFDGKSDFSHFYNAAVALERRGFNRKNTKRFNREFFTVDDDEAATSDIKDDFNLEEQITAKKKADQRQLIDSLLNGADETTTAIIATFLAHPKPTATAIAKELGVHHSKVTRALSRLAAKYSTKQFGDYTDYLIAL